MAAEPAVVQQLLLDWAVYLVAGLAMLLYKFTRDKAAEDKRALQDKAREDKDAYLRELAAFRDTLSRTISREDFDAHERREERDRDERRAAEHSIREQVHSLDLKIEGKLDTIMSHMIEDARAPHNRRSGDAR